VNNPFNQVVDASAGPIRRGQLTYSSFVRNIERVLVHDRTVIVMGVRRSCRAASQQTQARRFTGALLMFG